MVSIKRKLVEKEPENKPKKLDKSKSTKSSERTSTPDINEQETNKGRCSGVLKYILLVIFVPAFLNHAALYREAIGLKPPGELYDIGKGQKLYMGCMGKGKPTVILDAPTGMSSDAWSLIAPKLAKITQVCTYDRAGLGFSDRPFINKSGDKVANRGTPSTTERMVDDFHKLFTASSSQPKPYILVGAELGAVNTRFYTQLFEDNVAGLVLINPLIESMFNNDRTLTWIRAWLHTHVSALQTLQFSAAIGMSRLGFILHLMKSPIDESLVSDDVIARLKYLMCKPAHLSSAVDEYYFANESLSQMRTLSKLKQFNPGSVAISVLTSKTYTKRSSDSLNKEWLSVTQEIKRFFSPGIEVLSLSGSADVALFENSKTITDVIVKLINKWRKDTSYHNTNKPVNM